MGWVNSQYQLIANRVCILNYNLELDRASQCVLIMETSYTTMESTRSYPKHVDFLIILLVPNANHRGAWQSGCVLSSNLDGEHYVEFAQVRFLLKISLIQLVNVYYNILRPDLNILKASMVDKLNTLGVYDFIHAT